MKISKDVIGNFLERAVADLTGHLSKVCIILACLFACLYCLSLVIDYRNKESFQDGIENPIFMGDFQLRFKLANNVDVIKTYKRRDDSEKLGGF